jgi:vancomycin resistance protein YoaR
MDERTEAMSTGAGSGLGEQPQPSGPAHLVSDEGRWSDDDETPRHRRRWPLAIVVVAFALVGVLVVAWAVDTSSGGVPRNVTLAGMKVGGLSEPELSARVSELADELAGTPVELHVGDASYESTAADLGLLIDQDRTTADALDIGSDEALLLRPLTWLRSFMTERNADVTYQVSQQRLEQAAVELEGEARTPPTEPTIELVDGSFRVVPGVDGTGVDAADIAKALPAAAEEAGPGAAIVVDVEQVAIPPVGSDEEAEEAARQAEDLVNEPVEVHAGAAVRTISSEQLRTWVTLASQPDGSVAVDLDPARVLDDLRAAFADIDGHPVDASFTLSGGTPVILPDEPGVVCCADDAPARILDAMRADGRVAELTLVDGPAAFTVAQAEAWGITQAVGGNNAWRSGAPTTAGPGFTTYHAAGGARVTNIHRIADIVRGAIVPPGGSFSVNELVGQRTTAKGFVAAGAIANGEHVDEIGGGISQFATTTFNAAYFAGLDIDEYQAHSEYFDRYPLGREATMGYPKPDLRFTNNTPFGILIWTSYTDTSLTVTLYSTPYATAEQTGIKESSEGACRVVVTTRTRTFPDGHSEDDTFRARYRPGPSQGC